MADERERKPVDFSRMKNKIQRSEVYWKEKIRKAKEKRERRKKRKREDDALGDEAPPKQVPRTIENTRVKDETIVNVDDEEILNDEATDELSLYFKREVTPKVVITSSDRPKNATVLLMEELCKCIPNSEVRQRKGRDLKKIIPQAVSRGYTAMVVINEDNSKPNGLVVTHLPDGPTAYFKLTSVKLPRNIWGHGRMTSHRPELILNHFNTRLGHSVARLLAALYPYDPQFQGRQCVTFHNQRDFIFFRRHRYIFRNSKKVGLQELGPRFTLKLRSLQKGTFDSKFGEYEWIHKRKQMDTSRRKFHL
ncbi:ribosome production factor 1-like [Actinia tenebrosa]|uniref:Ribosome production factor 1-like n=1 Tax=Actinia tenebrosa TaxID=6105 RepID=A0A6P8HMP2_ACTTE|nr:ribosome production factor 1-like [Actinia tenebrosa]